MQTQMLPQPTETTKNPKFKMVLSPVVFCIYIGGLLTKLSESGVGCYMGNNFLGALGYTDDYCPHGSIAFCYA